MNNEYTISEKDYIALSVSEKDKYCIYRNIDGSVKQIKRLLISFNPVGMCLK